MTELYFQGLRLNTKGEQGPKGSDGNPVGTILSYLGRWAPNDYLICDGGEYAVELYPDLVQHFRDHFGVSNYFGGDGVNTFCVPDMRNLFLRGYHGGDESLTADVGIRQDATALPLVWKNHQDSIILRGSSIVNYPENIDQRLGEYHSKYVEIKPDVVAEDSTGVLDTAWYTTRPVNMSVVYCIKAK